MHTLEVHQAHRRHLRIIIMTTALTGRVAVAEALEAEVQEAIAEAGTPIPQARSHLDTTY